MILTVYRDGQDS